MCGASSTHHASREHNSPVLAPEHPSQPKALKDIDEQWWKAKGAMFDYDVRTLYSYHKV